MPDWNIEGAPGQKPRAPKPRTIKKSPRKYDKKKKSQLLLRTLKEEHDFDLLAEIIKIYREADDLEDDHERIKIQRGIQRDFMKYSFPTLKSAEIRKDTEHTVINISLPGPTPPKKVSSPQLPDPDTFEGEIIDGD